MNFFLWLLASLASFRLALMFSKEKGPGDVFEAIRNAESLHEGIKQGLACILCESVWWAGVITVYLSLIGQVEWELAPIYWLATSAAACIVHFQWNQDEP